MKSTHLFLACACTLFLGSCKSATSPADSTTIEQLLPITVGNYWVYHNFEYYADGTVKSDYTDTLTITGTQVFAGQTAYQAKFSDIPNYALFYFSGSSLYTVAGFSTTPRSQLTMRYPMNAGESVVAGDSTFPDGSRREALVVYRGNNESVTVPANTYSCYHFENINLYGPTSVVDTTNIDVFLISPGIGLVQEKHYYKSNGVTKLGSTASLTRFYVK